MSDNFLQAASKFDPCHKYALTDGSGTCQAESFSANLTEKCISGFVYDQSQMTETLTTRLDLGLQNFDSSSGCPFQALFNSSQYARTTINGDSSTRLSWVAWCWGHWSVDGLETDGVARLPCISPCWPPSQASWSGASWSTTMFTWLHGSSPAQPCPSCGSMVTPMPSSSWVPSIEGSTLPLAVCV